MSGRPPWVKVGDRVRITSVHTGIITELDDDGFKLLPKPGRPVVGSFHGDGEMTWVILPPPLPPEPPDWAAVRIGARGNSVRITWAEVCALGTPVVLVPEPPPC